MSVVVSPKTFALTGLNHPRLFHFFGTRRLTSVAEIRSECSVIRSRQVHGDRVIHITHPIASEVPLGDALISDIPGIVLTISTADCVPVLLFDPVRPAIAAIHAGWRGSLSTLVQKTVRVMGNVFGSNPAHLSAGIGPAIGPCCYEVGREVWEAVEQTFPYGASLVCHTHGEKAKLDLPNCNRMQLSDVGIPAHQIYCLDRCTACHDEDFYSYRRDRCIAGSLLSGLVIEPVAKV